MNSSQTTSTADLGDRHRRFMAFAMLSTALMYLLSAARRFAGPDMASFMKGAELLMILLALGFVAPIFVWKLRASASDERHLYFGLDGFVADTLARAHAVSWRSTFLLILVLAPFADNLSTLSPKVFLELVLAEMLGVFALVFLYLNRATPEDELEDSPSA